MFLLCQQAEYKASIDYGLKNQWSFVITKDGDVAAQKHLFKTGLEAAESSVAVLAGLLGMQDCKVLNLFAIKVLVNAGFIPFTAIQNTLGPKELAAFNHAFNTAIKAGQDPQASAPPAPKEGGQ